MIDATHDGFRESMDAIEPTKTSKSGATLGRRSFLKLLATVSAGIGFGAWGTPSAQASTCGYAPGAVVYTQNNHTCISNESSVCPGHNPFKPTDKWSKYYNNYHTIRYCTCQGICVGTRCNGSKQSWMSQIGYSYCCDICT